MISVIVVNRDKIVYERFKTLKAYAEWLREELWRTRGKQYAEKKRK